MNDAKDNNHDYPIEVFAGTGWEVGLMESLLENAEIEAFIYYGGETTLVPGVYNYITR